MQIKNLATFFAVIALAGCAATLTDKAAKIQVHSQMSTLLAACQKIGPVTGMSKAVWSQPTVEAKIEARGKVADMGGDTLVVTNIDETSDITGFVTTVHGTAMRCY